jgi:hypothetical protein
VTGQRFTDQWVHAVRGWLIGTDGPAGEQLPLPGMPEPPARALIRVLPFVLVTYADRDGGGVRPGKRNLARVFGIHERHVRRALIELERLGLIERAGDSRGGRGRTVVFRLVIPQWLQKGGTRAPVSVAKGGHSVHEKGGTGAPPPIKRPGTPLKGGPQRPPSEGARQPPPPHLAPDPEPQRSTA